MTLNEILLEGGGLLLVVMTLVQIAPVKLNPWSWFGNQVNKDLLKEIATMRAEIDTIRDENREVHVKDCRVRILRFADEIYLEQPHSQEHFKQILGDITHYERYCESHKKFENQIAVAAIAQIKETYNARLRKHDFLR